MLRITIPEMEWWDEQKNEFIYVKETTLQLEHSLIAVSKWESKWKIPYFGQKEQRTLNQRIDYVRCMTINSNVDPMVYGGLTPEHMKTIQDYIADDMTATTIGKQEMKEGASRMRRNFDTSETIYAQMVQFGIPFECQKWHLSRLLTLIRVCQVREQEAAGSGRKRRSDSEILRSNAALNAARRAKSKSKG